MAVIGRRFRDIVVAACMLFLAILIIAKLENTQALRSRGPFVAIDGDTLADGVKRLRLRGIDAPELGQTCKGTSGDYACGQVARARLTRLLERYDIECAGIEGDEDRYRRLLVTCRSGDLDIARQMVTEGLAAAEDDYQMAEREARDARVGIWAGDFERPEDWRRRQKLAEREQNGWLRTLLSGALAGWFGQEETP